MTNAFAHLGLLDAELLAGVPSSFSPEQQLRVNQLRDHLRSCAECEEFVQADRILRGLRTEPATAAGNDCPEYDAWLEIAAGVASKQDAVRWMQHAAGCSDCAAELEAARTDMGSDAIEQEIQALESSQSPWQERTASHLRALSAAAVSSAEAKRGRVLPFPKRRVWFGVIAAMLLLSLSLAGWHLVRANSEGSLLAAAYDAQRRTDLHLPGGDAVPLASFTRGASAPSEPTELLRLRLRAQEHLDKDPNDAYWHLVLGRVALVENNGQAAREQIAAASALNPALPGLESDLAAAYFEIGEASGDLLSYARSVDIYGQVIDGMAATPDKEALARAYFNRALCWERQSILYEAAKDYREALKTEQNQAWRQEINERLVAVLKASSKSEAQPRGESNRSPESFLQVADSPAHPADDQYEFYLDAATRSWLPQAGSSPATHDALLRLAALGATHNDRWVRDMLLAPSSKLNLEAALHLSRALEANAAGDADTASRETQQAVEMFGQAANRAGMLRAEVEAIYTLQRQAKASECLQRAYPLLRLHTTEPYAWLHGHLLLEAAACNDSTGKAEQPVAQVTDAMQRARAASLPLQALRAEGFLVAGYDSLGQTQEAWNLAAQGLRECAGRSDAAMPAYQFLQSIHLALTTKGLHYTAAGMADAAAHASEAVSNLQVRAYAEELLGRDQTKLGHEQNAAQAFSSAEGYLKALPSGAATRLYHADWEADGSEWLARRGQLDQALSRMKDADGAVSATDNFVVRQDHYMEFARLLLMQRDASGAAQELAPALRDTEASLSSTQGESQRLAWERSNGRVYRLLVDCLEMKGEAETALRAWEWYRAAAYRTTRIQPNSAKESTLSKIPGFDPRRLAALTLVLGRTEDGYTVWSIGPAGDVRMLRLAAPSGSIEDLADTFAELCAHRESSVQAIRITGNKLFGMLFAAYRQQIDGAGSIQLDIDPRLQHVPFAALTQPDGRYMGLAHGLVFLPAWWSVRSPRPAGLPPGSRVLLVEGRQAGEADPSGAIAILPQQYLETRDLEARFPGATVLRAGAATSEATLRLLPSAQIFHYSGHTVARGSGTSLLLGGHEDTLRAADLASLPLRNLFLATLAACSSGGDTGGVSTTGSLAHALLAAGAGAVVATLWDVDTQSSRELMTGFYAALSDRRPFTEALRSSQAELAASVETSHPYFWAASEVFIQ